MSAKRIKYIEGIIMIVLMIIGIFINIFFFFGLLLSLFCAFLHHKVLEIRYSFLNTNPYFISIGFVINLMLLVIPLFIGAVTRNIYFIFGIFSGLLYYRMTCFIEGLYIK